MDGVPVIVALEPTHIVALEIVKEGFGLTVTVCDTDTLEQPFNVYTHEYDVVTLGETVIDDVVAAVFHKYVPPKEEGLAENVALLPWQIVELGIVIEGIGFTVTTADVDALEQPFNV